MEYIYAALLLHKLGEPINENNLKKVISATGKEVDEAKIKVLTASLQGVDIEKELEQASLISAQPAETKKEEKVDKKEEKVSEAAEGLSALFA